MIGAVGVLLLIIAAIMNIAGWGSGHLDVANFYLVGIACVAVHLCFGWGHRSWNNRGGGT